MSSLQLCSWPPRNAPVFTSLNMTMERCNDLLELVQTMEHFRYTKTSLQCMDIASFFSPFIV